jgi:hypothetical protein
MQGADINTVLHKLNAQHPPKIKDYSGILAARGASNPNYEIDLSWSGLYMGNFDVGAQDYSGSDVLDINNDLDTGSEASSTWYYIWAFADGNGTAIRPKFSASATSPTAPSGAVYQRLVSMVYNNGSSNFVAYGQEDDWWEYDSASNPLSGGTQTSFTTINLAAYIPDTDTINDIFGSYRWNSSANGNTMALIGYINGAYRGSAANRFLMGGGALHGAPYKMRTETQGIQYKITAGNAAEVSIAGFEVKL